MSRRSQIELHDSREAIERGLIEGRPILQLSEQYGVSRNALYRYQNRHLAASLAEQLRGVNRDRSTRLIQRLADIADDHARAREVLQANGDIGGAVRAGDAETRAIVTLLDRLGIDDLATLDLLAEGDALARAAGRLARANPAAGRQLVGILHQLGATTLADALGQITTPQKEVTT